MKKTVERSINTKTAKKPAKKRVLMALSGGIDSAVSAWKLLKDGYEVEAAFMKNWSSTAGLKYNECPWLVDRQDALRVAAFLGIKMHTVNYEKQYEKNVMSYFFKEYKAGRTPNPDVMCNKEIKFKLLYNWAIKNGFDYVATGHYAQIGKNKNGLYLKTAKDTFKDQTYFIYNLKSEQLDHVMFPIGNMKKPEVKKLAQKIGLPNATKKESMGLCFVGKIRLKDFLEQKLKVKTGDIISTSGQVLGKHQGLPFYTIGQRQGVQVGANGPWYVVSKNLKNNTLVVTNDPKDKLLQMKSLQLHSVNWITSDHNFPKKLTGRYRHQGNLEELIISQLDKDLYQVEFKKPQTAIASGQSLVLYHNDQCVGGGVIV